MASSPRIEDLRKKFEENPRRYFAPLANEYRKAGQIDQAIAICREYLPQQPGHMSGHIVYGQALYEAKQYEEGKTVFETALSLDPENLIALRHLGDIALVSGDGDAAKGWYKRVLDADPRNEEIQAQLALLEKASSAAPTPVVGAPAQPKPASKGMTAATAPTVVMKAMGPPGKPAAATPTPAAAKPAAPTPAAVTAPTPAVKAAPSAESPTAEIRLDAVVPQKTAPMPAPPPPPTEIPKTLIMEAPGIKPADAASAAAAANVAPTLGLETTSLTTAAAAPAIDGFSLEGLETTSLAATPPASPPPPAAPASLDAAGVVDLDISLPAASPPPPPPPPPAAAPEISLDFAAPPPAAPSAPAPMAAPAAAELPLIDLDAPAAPAPTPAPVAAASPPIPEIALDIPSVVAPMTSASAPEPALLELDVAVPAPARAAAPVPAPVAPPPVVELEAPVAAPSEGPFVTETMAELYLQQGHRAEALRVYRALLEQRPEDASLRAKIASLEAPLAPPVAQGPTIQAVLQLVAQRRPGFRPAPLGQNGGSPATHAAVAPVPQRLGPDALAALWGGAPPAPNDENAAIVLAMAFADLNGEHAAAPLALSGAAGPAAVVSVPAGPPPSNFSFDKFFSQRATNEHPAVPPPGAGAMESPEDVAHFTQWLEGLKKS